MGTFEIQETYKSSQELSIPLKTFKVTKKRRVFVQLVRPKADTRRRRELWGKKKNKSAMPSSRMKRIDINADRKQTSDCTRVARGKKMQRSAHREKEREGEEKKGERKRENETNMRLGEHRCVYSSAAGRHVGTSERGGSERNRQRPPPVITDVNYVRTRTRAGTEGGRTCAVRVRDGAERRRVGECTRSPSSSSSCSSSSSSSTSSPWQRRPPACTCAPPHTHSRGSRIFASQILIPELI